jgi:uncharacterized protein
VTFKPTRYHLFVRRDMMPAPCYRDSWCEMTDQTSRDPVLKRFREALAKLYGDRLDRAVLFGSRARGDARPDSDYDIAVFIREPDGWLNELIRLADAGTEILMETGAVISAKPFSAGSYNNPLPLMRTIRREGLDL